MNHILHLHLLILKSGRTNIIWFLPLFFYLIHTYLKKGCDVSLGNPRIVRYKGHYYDMGTSNKSFLQLASDLNKLGVKNCYFMLEIFDYTLINVDPYAIDEKTGHTSLTKDQITRIITECKRNPWYF